MIDENECLFEDMIRGLEDAKVKESIVDYLSSLNEIFTSPRWILPSVIQSAMAEVPIICYTSTSQSDHGLILRLVQAASSSSENIVFIQEDDPIPTLARLPEKTTHAYVVLIPTLEWIPKYDASELLQVMHACRKDGHRVSLATCMGSTVEQFEGHIQEQWESSMIFFREAFQLDDVKQILKTLFHATSKRGGLFITKSFMEDLDFQYLNHGSVRNLLHTFTSHAIMHMCKNWTPAKDIRNLVNRYPKSDDVDALMAWEEKNPHRCMLMGKNHPSPLECYDKEPVIHDPDMKVLFEYIRRSGRYVRISTLFAFFCDRGPPCMCTDCARHRFHKAFKSLVFQGYVSEPVRRPREDNEYVSRVLHFSGDARVLQF